MTDDSKNRGWVTAGLWLLLVVALVLSFGPNFSEMWVRWFPGWRHAEKSLYDRLMEGESYYTHAPLVPLVSLFIALLLIRHTSIPARPNRLWGSVVTVAFLLAHMMASLARVNFASGFALIGVLAGLILLLWGTTALRRLWFPLALLVFMVPLPEVSIAQLNFRLKMFAADWGVKLADFAGVMVARKGNQVMLAGDKSLVIANVCNGLRTLISLTAFGALYAYVCRLRGWWRVGLFLMSIPVAVVVNSIRIMSLIVVADIWSEDVATGWYHDTSGILIFVMAFLFMFGMEKMVLGIRKFVGKPAEVLPLFYEQLRTEADADQWPRLIQAGGTKLGMLAVVLAGMSALGAWWLSRSIPTVVDEAAMRGAVPASLTADGSKWELDPNGRRELDEQTLTILEFPAYLLRQYRRSDDMRAPGVELCVIFSKDNRKGTHPPDLCLEGSGQDIVGKRQVTLHDVEGLGKVVCQELVIRSRQAGPRLGKQYFLYTYKCGDKYTTSFWTQQLTIFMNGLLNRNASGALIRVWTPVNSVSEASLAEARRRAMGVLAAALPHLHRNLP